MWSSAQWVKRALDPCRKCVRFRARDVRGKHIIFCAPPKWKSWICPCGMVYSGITVNRGNRDDKTVFEALYKYFEVYFVQMYLTMYFCIDSCHFLPHVSNNQKGSMKGYMHLGLFLTGNIDNHRLSLKVPRNRNACWLLLIRSDVYTTYRLTLGYKCVSYIL